MGPGVTGIPGRDALHTSYQVATAHSMPEFRFVCFRCTFGRPTTPSGHRKEDIPDVSSLQRCSRRGSPWSRIISYHLNYINEGCQSALIGRKQRKADCGRRNADCGRLMSVSSDHNRSVPDCAPDQSRSADATRQHRQRLARLALSGQGGQTVRGHVAQLQPKDSGHSSSVICEPLSFVGA
jgi:hypothetical protein